MAPVAYPFQAGGVCAGWGACVNSTRTPGLLLCKCVPGHSGASDFFDNRVERLPDGTWLSFSCNESNTGTYVVWSLFLLCGLLRVYQITPIWIQFYKRHYADPVKVGEGIWKDAPLRIVTFDLFVVSVPYFITCFCKLGGMTFGTDVLPTITLVVTVLFFQLVQFDLTKTEFDIFVKGTANPAEAQKAKRFRMILKCSGIGFFFICNTIFSLWTLSTDKSLGPLLNGGSGEELAIYPRNLGSIVFGIVEIWTTWMIKQRVVKLLPSSNNQNGVSYIVTKMEKEMKTYVMFNIFLWITFSIFTVPFMLPYQTYLIVAIYSGGALRNTAKAFSHDKDIAKAKTMSVAASLEHNSKTDPSSKNSKTRSESVNSSFPKSHLAKVASPDAGKIAIQITRQDSVASLTPSVSPANSRAEYLAPEPSFGDRESMDDSSRHRDRESA